MKYFKVAFGLTAGWECGKLLIQVMDGVWLKLAEKYLPDIYEYAVNTVTKKEVEETSKVKKKNPIGFNTDRVV